MEQMEAGLYDSCLLRGCSPFPHHVHSRSVLPSTLNKQKRTVGLEEDSLQLLAVPLPRHWVILIVVLMLQTLWICLALNHLGYNAGQPPTVDIIFCNE